MVATGASATNPVLEFFDEVGFLVVALDPGGRIQYMNRALATRTGSDRLSVLGLPWLPTFVPAGEHAGLTSSFLEPTDDDTFGEGRFTSGLLTPAGTRSVRWTTAPFRAPNGDIVGSIAIGVDATERLATDAARERLQIAVEATADSVVITDLGARILYVNAAFEAVTGWTRDEAIGANPRIISSGRHPRAFYEAMWATLAAGRTWHGEIVNRRRDGTLFTEEATITPVRDADGSIQQYVGVKRDVTAVRALQARSDQAITTQASMSAILADLVPKASPEATAQELCERILALPGVAFAAIALFTPGDQLRTLAAVGVDGIPIQPVDPAGRWTAPFRQRARDLLRLVQTGPTVVPWRRAASSPMSEVFDRLGVEHLAMVPIVADGEAIGFLQVGAGGNGDSLRDLLTTLGSFGVLTSVLVGPQLGERARSDGRRGAIRRIIERRAFRPVFQPIVAMATGAVVGFEALTRFSDGAPPDLQFAAAAEAGLGVDLEVATLEAALNAAAMLPRDAWLDLNVSPALLSEPNRLAYLLWKAAPRPIILEITEHEAIEDYEQLRRRLDQLGVPVRLAVDDAGAGFASLRHILELRPDLIKLDRSLVVDIDRDPVRQGLVAGLRHFATTAGAIVVAEGIETPAEYTALIELGIELGQGYLLGRPGPAGKVRSHRFKPAERRAMKSRPSDSGGPDARDLVHRVNAILWEADGTDERMTFVSEGAASVTGHQTERWLSEPRFWEDHVHPEDRAAMLDAIGDAMQDGERVSLEYRFQLADGSYRWFEDLVEVLPGDGGHTRLVGVMIDVTDRRRLEDQLAYRAAHDSLTGLLNRDGFQQLVGRSLTLLDAPAAAVIFLDVDEFKIVNDSLGHRAGDDVLRLIAGRLRSAVRDSDAVARFGGDEFLVFATAADEAALLELGRRVVDVVAKPSEVGGRLMPHPVSAGIAFVQPDDTPESIIRNADLAMYAAKQAGGGRLLPFESGMHEAAVGRLDERRSS